MLEDVTTTQQMADMLKTVVLESDDVDNTLRLDVLRTIARFEQFGWHHRVMAQAFDEVGSNLSVTDSGIVATMDAAATLNKINEVVVRYIELYGYDQTNQQKLYTMQTAADYLGISRSMMETYVIRRGEIEGERIGRAWVFTQATLDAFKQRKRPRGRPSSAESQ